VLASGLETFSALQRRKLKQPKVIEEKNSFMHFWTCQTVRADGKVIIKAKPLAIETSKRLGNDFSNQKTPFRNRRKLC
jgi:hypothetical protein